MVVICMCYLSGRFNKNIVSLSSLSFCTFISSSPSSSLSRTGTNPLHPFFYSLPKEIEWALNLASSFQKPSIHTHYIVVVDDKNDDDDAHLYHNSSSAALCPNPSIAHYSLSDLAGFSLSLSSHIPSPTSFSLFLFSVYFLSSTKSTWSALPKYILILPKQK